MVPAFATRPKIAARVAFQMPPYLAESPDRLESQPICRWRPGPLFGISYDGLKI